MSSSRRESLHSDPTKEGAPFTTADKELGSSGRDSASDIDPEQVEGDYGSYRDHIFTDEKVAEYWRGVYENAKYEGRHRFDPSFTWSAQEEIAVKRKVSPKNPRRDSSGYEVITDNTF